MDKSILRQCASLLTEIEGEEKRIKILESEIKAMPPRHREVSDVVTKGKRGRKPLGRCVIHGNKDNTLINRKRVKLRERKAKKELHVAELDSMVIDADEYIYSIHDSEMRNILLFYCIDRKSWKEVADAMGEGYTAETCRQKFSRFMRVK